MSSCVSEDAFTLSQRMSSVDIAWLAPFVEFTAFWIILGRYSLDYCYLTHAVGAVLLGCLSIYYGTEARPLEEFIVRFSFGYFIGHGFEMVRQNDCTSTMAFHHVLALTLLVGVILNPEYLDLKATSNVLLTEFSTIFLYIWEKHPSENALAAFVLSYFVSRGIFLGRFIMRVFSSTDPADIASHLAIGPFHYFTLLLFVLNVLYFSTILIPGIPHSLKELSERRLSRPLIEAS